MKLLVTIVVLLLVIWVFSFVKNFFDCLIEEDEE